MEITRAHISDPAFVDQCFHAQGPIALGLRDSTARDRIGKLERLRSALLQRRQALYRAFADDFRKPIAEVELTELLPVVDEIRHAIKHLPKWMRPLRVSPTLTTLGTSARIAYQPRGRCLIISPWNYPVNTLISPLVSAIAAGNTAIVKPSELTPHVNDVVASVIGDVFAPNEVALIQGGVPTAQALLDLPFDHIFFTGSTTVGRIVMAAAAQHLSSVTLELGGKSPVIVDETADIEKAAETTMWAKLVNAGQTCVAPDYLLVHRSVRDQFVEQCRKTIESHFGSTDERIAATTDFARIISPDHTARIGKLIDDARSQGAQVLTGGSHVTNERYVAPTLLGNVAPHARIAGEEIFGPVLPVFEFDAIDDAIAHINARPKPLALYVWSRNAAAVKHLLRQTSSGGACVNHCLQHYAHNGLPFGGVGASGIGNSHGFFGFKAFSHERAVLRGGRLPMVKSFFPPYTSLKTRLARGLVDILAKA
ncbi:aldehyde dehydrogenase [Burkholderia ubonensis]|uniref:aldehyde dehydrogenase family protein n=1 Tax=Burkholderia ubonensis TaxID=101571 RepID=UPI0007564E62|nr:aldehyde dehydrogenase family protein [Burkholderia ubonensis]KWA74745.1 aldehyde dehydrogenase [Burkholderia ubonensis]KWB30346.1 aldehyde dehydrogenase [Burkholderia ubonensis]